MIVLGIIDSKPSTAAIVSAEEGVLAATAEERLSREKLATGVPRAAIEQVLLDSGVTREQVDVVGVAQRVMTYEPVPRGWTPWFAERPQDDPLSVRAASAVAPILGRFTGAWDAYHRVKAWRSRARLEQLPRLLREEHGLSTGVHFLDHHYCHATSAYFTCELEPALVISLDGGGDGRSGGVWRGRDGRLEPLTSIDSFNSLGNFYAYVTELCGFSAQRHEGKITGLAALADPLYVDTLRRFVGYHEPGGIRYGVAMYHRSALRRLRASLPEDFDRAALAASAQLVLEESVESFARYWLRQTGLRNLVVAGGVFANVKLNQRLHELEEVENFFVHPAMDDGGLALGAAYGVLEAEVAEPASLRRTLRSVYLGPEPETEDIAVAARAAGLDAVTDNDVHARIAELLHEGHVVARYVGRMEYGPRALGHRSILYRTDEPDVNRWLNQRLQRTEFMPFAPATLAEHADRCYLGLDGARDAARFMTITFDCSEEMKRSSPAVVHVDGTARPQIVDKRAAPDLHGILEAYHALSGNPSLVNTSFNMHEEPIVCTPDDAVRAFLASGIDYLAVGNTVARHPEKGERRIEDPAAV